MPKLSDKKNGAASIEAVFLFYKAKDFSDICDVKTLISIVGTTGIGKTNLSIQLANYFQTEIISCDSRQFFKGMEIGTAAPTVDELSEVPHHFIGNLSVTDYYSIGQYEIDALKKTEDLFQKHNIIILVGGSMMYEKALIEGLNDLPEANETNQKKLTKLLEESGIGSLQSLLNDLDPDYFQVVDKDNPRRLLRAIDVIWQTEKKYSELISEPKNKRNFNLIRIGIEAPREVIYDRINHRVDKMMESGLIEEVNKLKEYQDLVPLKTVGYTEFFKHFSGEWNLDFTVEEIKKNSRRFAKRQLTWYRKEDNIHWVNYQNALSESLSLLETLNIER